MPPFYIPSVDVEKEFVEEEENTIWNDELLNIADTVEDIYTDEEPFLKEEREEGKYYLGTVMYDPGETDHLLLYLPVSVPTFFNYTYDLLSVYTEDDPLCICKFYKHPIQITMDDGRTLQYTENCVVDKTIWFRIFQRQCRRHLQNRRNTPT